MRNVIADLLESLASCLCRTMAAEEQPDVCFCGVIPGDGIVANYGTDCEERNGLAWVRMANMYPASGTGIQDETPGSCGSLLGFSIEVGILRAVPVGDTQGNPPTPAELLASTQQQTMDAIIMRKAISCCEALDEKDYLLGQYTPGGPLGGMLGGTWAVSVAI